METFKEISKTEGRYLIANTGLTKKRLAPKILRLKSGVVKRVSEKEMRPIVGRKNRLRVEIRINGKVERPYLHRLVALHFVPNPLNRPHVSFKDGNPLNVHASNLVWTGCPAGY